MPSFTSAAAELRAIAKSWREGQRAFNQLFEVRPRESTRPYNEVAVKADAPTVYKVLYEEVSEAWVKGEARRLTKDTARTVSEHRQQVLEQFGTVRLRELPKDVREEMRTMRQGLAALREQKTRELTEAGGMLGRINSVQASSEGAKIKALMVWLLGQAEAE